MTLQGVDYSAGPMTGKDAHANGLSFVCRYVSTAGEAKNLRYSEVVDFKASGIGIVVVYEEHPVTRPLGGYAEGAADAKSADDQVTALGLAGCPIYFAVDFDAVDSQLSTVGAYMDGAASTIGFNRVGAYGSNKVIKYLLNGGKIRYAWAAIAWGGPIDPRTNIFQGAGGTVAGVDVDFDRTIASDTDYGQAGVSTAPLGVLEWITYCSTTK